MGLPRCEFRQGTATSLDTPDPLTCWPTAMTRTIAPSGEAYLDEMMGCLHSIMLSSSEALSP